MRKSGPQPRSRKTPKGGIKMASKILQMSEPVKGIIFESVKNWVGVLFGMCKNA